MLKFVQKGAFALALIGLAGCTSMSRMVSSLWPFGGSDMETKSYACDDGSRMIVVFDEREEAASVSITGRPMQTLHRQPDNDETHYLNASSRLRVEGPVARWEEQEYTTITCRTPTS